MANLLLNAAVGFAASGLVYLLQPRKTQKIEGARTTDLNAPKSNYGIQIPEIFGTARVPGNLIWANQIREVVKKKKSGGKGFGQKTETKTYTYFGDFATLLCKGPVVGIRKLWLNSKLVYNVGTDADQNTYDNSIKFKNQYLRFYGGEHDQAPDSLIQASLGIGNTNAYRNRAYIVFASLPLEDYGNRFPVVSAEVVVKGSIVNGRIIPQDENLSTIITKLCDRDGLDSSDIEVQDLSNISVRGFIINSASTVRQYLGELAQAYQFEAIESEGKIKFKKIARGRPSMVIRREDLAAREYSQSQPKRYLRTKVEELELPKKIALNYIAIEKDYAESVQYAVKSVADNEHTDSLNLGLVLTDGEAKAMAEKILYLAWSNRVSYQFSLLPKFSYLEPGDTVLLREDYGAVEVKISKIDLGANLLMEVEGTFYSSSIHKIPLLPTSPYNPPPQQITSQGDTNLKILDIPLVNDSDADIGVYVMGDGGLPSASGGTNWRGASVYVSRDSGANWNEATFLSARSTFGICNTVLDPNATSLSVTINSGELETVSTSALDAGENTAVVGSEIIRFTTATLTANRTYTLTGIQRGKRGTEWATSSHILDEPFYLVSDYIERIEGSFSDIGQTLQFKALTTGQSLDEVNPVTITFNGRSSKPYSPVNLISTKDAVGNISIAWDRRDRKGGDRSDYANLPLSEAYEKYEVDIYVGGIFRRTISTSSRSAYYSKEMQIADTGSIISQITVDVFQISGVVGRGNAGTGVLTPTFVNAAPKITGFSPVSGQVGDTIRIYGSGLAEVTSVAIGSVNCTNLAVVNDGEITAVVAFGTTTAKITVTALGGMDISSIAWSIATPPTVDLSAYLTIALGMTKAEFVSNGLIRNDKLDLSNYATIASIPTNADQIAQGAINLFFSNAERTKLSSVQTGATDDQTATEIRDLLSGLSGTNRLDANAIKNLTTNIDLFTNILKGLVPASGGGTTNFLRADGTWASVAAGSSGFSYFKGTSTVTSGSSGTVFPFFTNNQIISGTAISITTDATGTKITFNELGMYELILSGTINMGSVGSIGAFAYNSSVGGILLITGQTQVSSVGSYLSIYSWRIPVIVTAIGAEIRYPNFYCSSAWSTSGQGLNLWVVKVA
jgi:hypothetical protein